MLRYLLDHYIYCKEILIAIFLDKAGSVPNPNYQPVFYDIHEVCEILKIGKNTAYELVRSGQLKALHAGKSLRIKSTWLEEFAERGGSYLYSNKKAD